VRCCARSPASAWWWFPPGCLRRRIDAGAAAGAARALDQTGDEQDYMSAVNEAKCQIGAQ